MQNRRITASILFVLASSVCLAQEPPPPGTPPPPGLPIDGYLFIGICVGVHYGTKKLLKGH